MTPTRLTAAAGCALVLVGLLFIAVLGGVLGSGASVQSAIVTSAYASCQTSPLPPLTVSQSRHAATIVQVAQEIVPNAQAARAEQIAVMVALTESGLENLGPRTGNDGSVGLFQQRAAAGWGDQAEESNPVDAATMFLHHLLAVPHWSTIPPWTAAQDVQHSATTTGSNYQKHWTTAKEIVAGSTVALTAAGCGGGIQLGSMAGLPSNYTIPASASPQAQEAIAYAIGHLGDRYVWGAAGPSSFDCSGLTMMAWREAGVSLEHYTVSQLHEGTPVQPSAIQPGNLVFVPGTDPPGPGLPGHVGIYLGDGLVESAIDPTQGVAVQPYAIFISGGLDGITQP